MIEVTAIKVRTFDLDHLDVSWEIRATDEDVSFYDFFVLRSQDGAAGPFNVIAGPFFNTYSMRDPNVHLIHNWRTYYYKIKIVHRQSQAEAEYGPSWMAAPPDLIALEVQRRQQLVYTEFNGRRVLLFPRLTGGQRCAHCWDRGVKGNTIGRSKQQNCETCFDTTFVGGYASPMLLYAQIDPSTVGVQKADEGEHQFETTTARLAAFPPVRPKDMLVEAENKRWRVESVTTTEKLRAVVRQEMKLWRYASGDVHYKVPINLDENVLASPEREFTRPHDVEIGEHRPALPNDVIGDLNETGNG